MITPSAPSLVTITCIPHCHVPDASLVIADSSALAQIVEFAPCDLEVVEAQLARTLACGLVGGHRGSRDGFHHVSVFVDDLVVCAIVEHVASREGIEALVAEPKQVLAVLADDVFCHDRLLSQLYVGCCFILPYTLIRGVELFCLALGEGLYIVISFLVAEMGRNLSIL